MPPGPKANPLPPDVRSGQVWELDILKREENGTLCLCLLCPMSLSRTVSIEEGSGLGKAKEILIKKNLNICDLFLLKSK